MTYIKNDDNINGFNNIIAELQWINDKLSFK
jgi:hypothetical protein